MCPVPEALAEALEENVGGIGRDVCGEIETEAAESGRRDGHEQRLV